MAQPQSEQERRVPTEDAPETGAIGMAGEILSLVAYWVQDGDHVFRGLEWDVIVGDPDWQTATERFAQDSEDLAHYFSGLLKNGEAAEHEAELAVLILERVLACYNASAKEIKEDLRRARRRVINVPWSRRPDHQRLGYSPSAPASSSRLQPV